MLSWQLGINYFDTSPFYGLTKSEMMLGRCLEGVDRSKIVVSTKVGRYGDQEFDFGAERIKLGLEQSLARLGLDYVDIAICHDIEFGDIDTVVKETIPALKEMQRDGKVKYIGVSGLPIDLFRLVLERSKDVDCILSYCHCTMFDNTLKAFWEEKMRGLERNVGIINASPLSMGLLTNDGAPSWHPAPDRLKTTCQEVAKYCSAKGVDIASMALQHSVHEASAFAASTLVGMMTPDMVKSNVQAINASFPAEVMDWTRERLQSVQNLTWPSGLPQYNTKLPLVE